MPSPTTTNPLRSGIMNTYSVLAYDGATGQVGAAVQTHQMGVGRLVPWARPGVGAVLTQSLANISYGPRGLDLLAGGMAPQQVIDTLTADDDRAFHRQVAVMNAAGQVAAFTGELCVAQAGHHAGTGYSVQANMMANGGVISAMRQAYETAAGDLANRLMATLYAAEAEGGDIRGMQSAALVIVPPGDDDTPAWTTLYDLRVDEHSQPLDELARLVRLRKAGLIGNAGDAAFYSGDREQALQLWAQSRQLAPELEELAFWQALALADEGNDVETAATVFDSAFAGNPNREQWVGLVLRLEEARLVQRPGAAVQFVMALRESNP